ncbi:hypothetical protein [Telmatospirillum sp.]|uniref:hypothetical protein n=1 Tax=Telmatospirillum sp. TaxID=2079197 RepID=UPI00283DAD40|nr:hypothetical protein [Telmatospirillum sp.]MDR3435274.1 hypothetical protein [Telmatospirillum sp.]
MTESEIENDLSDIVSEDDLQVKLDNITNGWVSKSIGVESVDPILKFMEDHSLWDFGTPGPLVHFVERFYGNGYELRLVESLKRRPTAHTVWMLNRIINGEKNAEKKKYFLDVMKDAKSNVLTDQAASVQIDRFLRLHPESQ